MARLLGVVLVSLLALGVVPRVAGGPAIGTGAADLRARAMESSTIRGLRDGLSELGYVEGQTILIEYRRALPEPLPRAAVPPQITLVPFDVRTSQDFGGVFRSIRQQRVDALMMMAIP